MLANDTLTHDQVDPMYTWNAASVFPTADAWQTELEKLREDLTDLKRFEGHLTAGPETLADGLDLLQGLTRRVDKVFIYALMAHQVDTTDQAAAKMYGQAQSLDGALRAACAFLDPELIEIGEDTLRAWIASEPRLTYLAHYINDLLRKQAHVRSAEVEELLGSLGDPFAGSESTMGMLTDADFEFPAAVASDGRELPVTQGTLEKILAQSDREARRTAWEGYMDTYLAFKNTLASNLATSIKQNVFLMRARRHESTLAAAHFAQNVPGEVFENLIATFRANLPTWQRYWAVRRAMLGVETLEPYDIWAPLIEDKPVVPYDQAVDWICDGLAPLGEEYVATLRRGVLSDRWVDVCPTQGKAAGAFSAGSSATHPFINMSYNDDILSLSTLAHELGHSMHSYLTWQYQPVLYSDYSMFVAEVASNFHQAMVRAYLLEQNPDPVFQISVIEEAMANFYRYFFIMPTLARFEVEIHRREENGRGLTADDMNALMADLFAEGYGDGVHVDRDRVGIMWATFGHLYIDYYVYQYATGISGAHALSHRILSGQRGAVDDYLSFLKSGGSLYALDALNLAGVDLTTVEPVQTTFDVLADLVDRLAAFGSVQ